MNTTSPVNPWPRTYSYAGFSTLRRLALLALLLWLQGCASVPLDYPKDASQALTDTDTTYLARESKLWRDDQIDQNGFYPLTEGKDAFGARLVLMDEAEKSIDAQYFLMKPDKAGLVFTDELLEAAGRGVRVRLLLDDIFTTVDDHYFSFLDAHPNIEVRLFNPISRKGLFALNYVGHFSRANRRMHNKSFIVDNQVAIVGGRNIAEEYFQLETSGEFIDFDMFLAGPIVRQVSSSFDLYWNNALAMPMEAIARNLDEDEINEAWEEVRKEMFLAGNTVYGESINTPLLKQFSRDEIAPYFANARVIVDSPEKLQLEISEKYQVVANELTQAMSQARQEIILFTPYFIPGKNGIEFLRTLREKGIRIVVITNSLASNNHTAVHSAYSTYRKRLLEMGVELWEARADAVTDYRDKESGDWKPLTLHTKGILIDREKVFVGSLNLDPRSIDINTEMGILIDSPEMGALMVQEGIEDIPRMAYRLQLNEQGKIRWHATIDDEEIVETREPLTSGWRRFSAWFQKILPESQL